jgi:hypothetical protein
MQRPGGPTSTTSSGGLGHGRRKGRCEFPRVSLVNQSMRPYRTTTQFVRFLLNLTYC